MVDVGNARHLASPLAKLHAESQIKSVRTQSTDKKQEMYRPPTMQMGGDFFKPKELEYTV